MIKLWENDIPGYNPEISSEIPAIKPYLIEDGKQHGAVLVFPGGAYCFRADHEGEPIALWLNKIGLSAFVVDYRVAPYRHPYPLLDAQRAIRLVRYHAKEWNIDPDKIGVLGFSAGGHLVATAGTHFDAGNENSDDPIERVSSRPDAQVLCYPVISLGDYRHDGSKCNLIGGKPLEELRDSLSNEKCVTKDTPPAFLWHTADDDCVPVENSLMFAGALSRNNILFELHVYPHGYHGLGLASDDPVVSTWTGHCESWFRTIGFLN